MIKILVPGTKNRTDCSFCGAILSYDIDDIKEREAFITQRKSNIEKYIICPQCKKTILLEFKK